MKEAGEKYCVSWTSQFKRDYKHAARRGLDLGKIDAVIAKLAKGEELPPANRDRALSGRWARHRECHVALDWLLIYQIRENILVLELTRTGSHSDLF